MVSGGSRDCSFGVLYAYYVMYISPSEGCRPLPKPVKISWSALHRFQKCGYAQKLVSERKRAKVMDGRTFLLGNIVDNCMRRWLDAGDFTVPIDHDLRKVWIDNTGPLAERPIKWKSGEDQQKIVDDAKYSLKVLENILREKVIPYQYEPEMRFTSMVGVPAPNGETIQVELFGAIDVAVRYDDGTMGIFDLKTSRTRSYITKSIGQLVLYDLAIRNYLGIKPTKHGFYAPLLKKEPTIDVDITDDDRINLISDITNFAHAAWNNEWHLTDDWNNCYRCDVKHACIRWVKPLTLGHKKTNLENFGKK